MTIPQFNIRENSKILESAEEKDYIIYDDNNKEMEIGDIHLIKTVHKVNGRHYLTLFSFSGKEFQKYFDELNDGNWWFMRSPKIY
ncbi:MAG: hypothetical protein HY840_04710 [Bacteroidetes bacterium]|nr:hypothetical protein [Bacteroidota bacterium]